MIMDRILESTAAAAKSGKLLWIVASLVSQPNTFAHKGNTKAA